MALNLAFIPLVFFWYVRVELLRRISPLIHLRSYPETSNLTLEEIDFLFTKEGNTGLRKFARRSQPVQESLKPVAEIEADVEKHGSVSAGTDHLERKDEASSQD